MLSLPLSLYWLIRFSVGRKYRDFSSSLPRRLDHNHTTHESECKCAYICGSVAATNATKHRRLTRALSCSFRDGAYQHTHCSWTWSLGHTNTTRNASRRYTSFGATAPALALALALAAGTGLTRKELTRMKIVWSYRKATACLSACLPLSVDDNSLSCAMQCSASPRNCFFCNLSTCDS